jgi:hypothetical protein
MNCEKWGRYPDTNTKAKGRIAERNENQRGGGGGDIPVDKILYAPGLA